MTDQIAFCDDWTFDLPIEVDGESVHLRDLERILAVRPRLLLLGDPGSGKTSTLRWLAQRATAAREADPRRHPEPVLVPLTRWTASAGTTFAEFMTGYADASDLMLLIDGLNDLGPSPEARLHEIAEWLDTANPAQVVLTSRPPGPDSFDVADLARATLHELEPRQVDQIAERRLGPDAAGFLAQLEGSRLARNPYLLTAMLYLAERDPGSPIPDDTGHLLGRLAATVWERGRQRDPALPPWDIAFDSHVRLARALDDDAMGNDLTPEQVVEIFVGEQLPAASVAAGLLVRDGDFVRFEHDMLRAYFLAEALAGVGADGFLTWCRSNVAHWQATAVAWSGLCWQADEFLGKLHWSDAAELVGRGYVAGPEAVQRHVERAMSDLFAGGWRTFPQVLTALARVGDPAVPTLVAGLGSVSDEQARARVAYVLGQIAGDDAVSALRPMLRAAPGQPRAQAWSALLSIGGDEAHLALSEWFADPEPGLRAAAATSLAHVDRPAREAELVRLADDEDPRVRAAAIVALGKIGARRYAGVVARHASEDDPAVRAAVMKALAAFGDSAGRAQIEAALADPEESVRLEAVAAAGNLGADAVPSLLLALDDASDAVREKALESLAAPTTDATVIYAAIEAFAAGSAPVRKAAAKALATMGAGGRDALRSALSGDDPALWEPAAEQLLRAGWSPRPGDEEIRVAVAVRAWGRCLRLGPDAVPELRRTLAHAGPERRRGIARVLRELGFRPEGTDPDLFRYYAGLVDWQAQRRADAIDMAGFAAWMTPPAVDGQPLRETARLLATEATQGIDEGLLRATLDTGDRGERMLATVVAGWTGAGRAELIANLLRPDPAGMLPLLAAQALGEQPMDTEAQGHLLRDAAAAAAGIAPHNYGIAEAVLVSAIQAVGRATEVTDILDDIPAISLGADDRLDLLEGLWSAFGPDVAARLGEISIGDFLRALAGVDRDNLPAVSTLNFPLVLWEMQRRVAVLTMVMFMVGLERDVVRAVLRVFALLNPAAVSRVLSSTGRWAAADFAADVKELADELAEPE